jgi:peptidoglycan/LPS O-acetylase OafA/YrhL
MVVTFHYTYRAPGQWGMPTTHLFPQLSRVTVYGALGVQLFFVISGFVICMSAWGRGLGAFVTSRATRLFPAYWFGVLATASLVAVAGHGGIGFSDLLLNLAMVQMPIGAPAVDGVYWSLWVELHFYLLFAIVVWRGLTYRRAVLFCALWITASVLASGAPPLVQALVDPGYAPYFVAGIAMYLMRRFRPTILLWAIVGVSYALALHYLGSSIDTINSVSGRRMWYPGEVAIFTGIFVIMLAVALGWLDWVRGAWLTVAGALTYPLYLLHQVIGWWVIEQLHDRVAKWPLLIGLVAAMLVAAWLVHRLVERPLAPRLKRALTGAMASTSMDQEPRRAG